MPHAGLFALAGFAIAAIAMPLVTQTKERVRAPAWLAPLVVVVPFAALTGVAIATEGLFGFVPILLESFWRLQSWFDPLMSVAAAFYLLQNRARAAGMKSEVWVIVVIVTGGLGLFLMLAGTVLRERKAAC